MNLEKLIEEHKSRQTPEVTMLKKLHCTVQMHRYDFPALSELEKEIQLLHFPATSLPLEEAVMQIMNLLRSKKYHSPVIYRIYKNLKSDFFHAQNPQQRNNGSELYLTEEDFTKMQKKKKNLFQRLLPFLNF